MKPVIWTDLESVIAHARTLGPGHSVVCGHASAVYAIVKTEVLNQTPDDWATRTVVYETKLSPVPTPGTE